MIPQPVGIGIWVAIGVVLLIIIFIGIRRLGRRGTGVVPPLPAIPADAKAVTMVAGTYVTSNLAGDWLARVGTARLWERSTAGLGVCDGEHPGVLIARDGAPDLFIPAQSIEAVQLTSGMAGKAMGKAWIVHITWAVPESEGIAPVRLETGFLPRNHKDVSPVREAILAIAPDAGRDAARPEDEPQSRDQKEKR